MLHSANFYNSGRSTRHHRIYHSLAGPSGKQQKRRVHLKSRSPGMRACTFLTGQRIILPEDTVFHSSKNLRQLQLLSWMTLCLSAPSLCRQTGVDQTRQIKLTISEIPTTTFKKYHIRWGKPYLSVVFVCSGKRERAASLLSLITGSICERSNYLQGALTGICSTSQEVTDVMSASDMYAQTDPPPSPNSHTLLRWTCVHMALCSMLKPFQCYKWLPDDNVWYKFPSAFFSPDVSFPALPSNRYPSSHLHSSRCLQLK